MTVTIVSGDGRTAPQVGRFGTDPSEERAQAPFTEDHRTALLDVAVCSGPQGGRVDACIHAEEWVGACLHLEDGMLVWDAGVGRLSFAAVRGIDGMYVEVLTTPAGSSRGTTLVVEADWPISLELPRETARTIWHLIGIFSI